jgi:4-amino-4-deoxy-L-arabinose transferase-like glycosyltransferase
MSQAANAAVLEPAIVVAPARPLTKVRRWELLLVTALACMLYLPRLGAYNLWDPWETHYGEVARRMLAENDWIHTRWQNESFRSKPVLTFWLMGLGMKAFDVADGGGYSGEMVANPMVEWAVRLPFALFGIGGLVLLWYALARLYSRRAAWICATVLATSPYYFFISRQAITDMPACAMLIMSVALFALAVFDDDQELRGRMATRQGFWLFQGLLGLAFVGPALGWVLAGGPALVVGAVTIAGYAAVLALSAVRARGKQGALFDGLAARWSGFHALHWLLLAFVGLAMLQLSYFVLKTQNSPLRFTPESSLPGPYAFVPFILVLIAVTHWMILATTKKSQVLMYWFYVISGFALLARGPLSLGLAGLAILSYLILSGEWRLLRKVELVRGPLVAALVGIPWHVAMFLKDGLGWWNEYVGQHILNRISTGVYGDRGTFDYFMSQIGAGMWPWAAFVPVALVGLAFAGRPRTREERLRLLFGAWAITGFTFFCFITTKFHHYILPAVPGLACVVGFYLDDLVDGRVRWPVVGLVVALGVFLVMSLDLTTGGELRLTNLYIFRYDRPWPSEPPWSISFTEELTTFVIAVGLALVLVMVMVSLRARDAARLHRLRLAGVGVLLVAATAFAVFVIQGLMVAASPHWGQKHLHEVYYQKRHIMGVDLIYDGLRELGDDFADGHSLTVRSVIPETMRQGDRMTISVQAAGETLELAGETTTIDRDDHRFIIELDAESRGRLAPLLARAKSSKDAPRRRHLSLDADRLLAWQLNWRGENFYSGGEIYQHRFPDAQTVFMKTDNTEFKQWIQAPERAGKGRRFFVITEKNRLKTFPGAMSSYPVVKQTFKIEDDSSNKFGLGSFQLDGQAPPRTEPELPPGD